VRLENSWVPAECRALACLAEFIVIGIKELSELVEMVSMSSRTIDACPECQATAQAWKSPVLNMVFLR
jgi:hypothetical protein